MKLFLLFFLVSSLAYSAPLHRMNDSIDAGAFVLPLSLEPLLTGNFGELRSDHFHSGLDFKTQSTIGHPVVAVADGWVSRISVRARGYGKALYIDHPNGYTSVYAHLDGFSSKLDSVVRSIQYARESYAFDQYFPRGKLPVTQGELIASSGNTGSSGGPHLHFELRHSQTQEPIDPLLWYAPSLIDREPPRMLALAVYALEGGVLSTAETKAIFPLPVSSTALPKVWGDIAFGVKVYDYMTGTNNIYSPCRITLFLDEEAFFSLEMNRFSFAETRYLNALVDYAEWITNRSWFIKSFREKENRLSLYSVLKNRGVVSIDQERTYQLRVELADRHGNVTNYRFEFQGESMPVPPVVPDKVNASLQHRFQWGDAFVELPAGALYSDAVLVHNESERSTITNHNKSLYPCFSKLYQLHEETTPLHRSLSVNLPLSADVLDNKAAYCLAKMHRDGYFVYVPARYEHGEMRAELSQFGRYVVTCDTLAPRVTFPTATQLAETNEIRLIVEDDFSGIAGYRVCIDGKWQAFEDDYKNKSLVWPLNRLGQSSIPQPRHLQLKIWDACGNTTQADYHFLY